MNTKKEAILSIDTADNSQVTIRLKLDDKVVERQQEASSRRDQAVLPLIENLLNEQNLKFSDLTAIQVNLGPGSFTGLKVGVAVANTLGTVLNIPINNNPPGQPVEPIYE